MGKPITYEGDGPWKIMVLMPEPLARQAQAIIKKRGCTCSELSRLALMEYMERNT